MVEHITHVPRRARNGKAAAEVFPRFGVAESLAGEGHEAGLSGQISRSGMPVDVSRT